MPDSSPPQAPIPNRPDDELRSELNALRSEVAALRQSIVETREVIALAERTRAMLSARQAPGPALASPQADQLWPPAGQPESPAPRPSDRPLSVRERASDWLDRQRQPGEWSPSRSLLWDALAVAIILLVAGFARYWQLDKIPLGIQGDEAAAGLEARRILDEGWIGIFSPAASGNPTAFFYLTVPTVWAFGNEVLSVRLTSATIDVVTILMFYVLLRRNFGFLTANIGSLLLAVSAWHIHFSRIAFMNILWPLLVVLGLIAFGEAHRTRSRIWWAVCGAFLASGIYAYNGHFLYLGVLGAFFVLYFFDWQALVLAAILGTFILDPGNITAIATAAAALLFVVSPSARNWRRWLDVLAFGAGFSLVFAAMGHLMWTDTDRYFSRGRRLSIFNSDDWHRLDSLSEQVRFLGQRYIDFWLFLADHPNTDYVAGSGSAAIVPIAALALAAAGVGLGLLRRPHPLIALGLMTILLMPLAPITSNDFALRRAMIMAPFLAMLCAVGAVELVRICRSEGRVLRYGSILGVAMLLGQIAYANLHGFFEVTAKSEVTHWVLSQEFVEAIDYMDTLPDGTYIYFFSSRWPFTHETIRYLAGDLRGETRGEPYGIDSIDFDPANGPSVVVLMGDDQDRLAEIQSRYPGGQVIESDYRFHEHDRPAFVAYVLPANQFPPETALQMYARCPCGRIDAGGLRGA